MSKSMTGYGRGEAQFEGRTVVVEVRSVNNRYLDCSVKLPRSYIFAEDAIRSRVQSVISRGKVDVFVNLTNTGGDAVSVTVNEPGDGQRVRMDYKATDLARFPDVLTVEKQEEDQDTVKEQLLTALDLALADFSAMREREGNRLEADILSRTDVVEALVAQVEVRSPETVNDYRTRLEAKMAEVLQNTQIDEGRLLTEAAIFADKISVDEETVRLRSHLSQLRELITQEGPVGRKLDFLIQECNREANTIGSKCSDIEIVRHVVDIKAEIEKIREQVQNLE